MIQYLKKKSVMKWMHQFKIRVFTHCFYNLCQLLFRYVDFKFLQTQVRGQVLVSGEAQILREANFASWQKVNTQKTFIFNIKMPDR